VQRDRRRSTTLRLGLVTSLLLATACGSETDPPRSADTAVPTGRAPADREASPEEPDVQEDASTEPRVLTETDDGSTVTLTAGDEVALHLSSDWVWDEPRFTGDAIELTRVDHFVDPGYAEWRIAALTTGEVELTASGEPNCGDPADCPARTVRIVIEVAEQPEATGLDAPGWL
jgi:predicted secreted protein